MTQLRRLVEPPATTESAMRSVSLIAAEEWHRLPELAPAGHSYMWFAIGGRTAEVRASFMSRNSTENTPGLGFVLRGSIRLSAELPRLRGSKLRLIRADSN